MQKLSFLLLLFFLAQSVFGQQNKNNIVNAANMISTYGEPRDHFHPPAPLTDKNTENIEDALYNKHWRQGHAIINDSTTSNIFELIYSNYTNELLFIEDGKKNTVPAKYLKGFVLNDSDDRVIFRNGFSSKKHDISSEQMMRVIYDGNIQLLAKEYAKLHESKDPFTGQIEFQFFPKTSFFIVKDSGFHKIKLNEDDILEMMNGHQQKIKHYAKSNGFTFENEADLTKILSHFDTISSS